MCLIKLQENNSHYYSEFNNLVDIEYFMRQYNLNGRIERVYFNIRIKIIFARYFNVSVICGWGNFSEQYVQVLGFGLSVLQYICNITLRGRLYNFLYCLSVLMNR